MGCFIKVKAGEKFYTFDTEEEAMNWVNANRQNLSIDEFLDSVDYKFDKKYVFDYSSPTEQTKKMFIVANRIAYQSTREILSQNRITDIDYEVYNDATDTWSLGELLKQITVINDKGENVRLFPEFIMVNYMNVLIQQGIINKVYRDNNPSEDMLISLRQNIFNEEAIKNSGLNTDSIISAKEWYTKFKSFLTGEELNDTDLARIDFEANTANDLNLDSMLRGEIIHKIFEEVITKRDSKGRIDRNEIKNNVFNIFDKFIDKYVNNPYKDHNNPKPIIENLRDTYNSYINTYIDIVKKQVDNIEAKYRANNLDANISWVAEQRITAELKDSIDGKKKLRGKVDAVIIVDGIPHIIDFKISRKSFNEWNHVKKIKTDYTMAMYYRMLENLGFPTDNTTLNICNIQIDSDGNIVGQGEFHTLNNPTDSTMNKKLDTFFEHVTKVDTVSAVDRAEFKEHCEALFGEVSARGNQTLTVEDLTKKLKERIYTTNNKRKLKYRIFNLDKQKYTNIVKELDNNIDEDVQLEQIAADIIKNDIASANAQYEILENDINSTLTVGKDITSWNSVQGDPDLMRYYQAVFSKYKNRKCKVLKNSFARENNVILIQTEYGIDVITLTQYDPFGAYDITNKNQNLLPNSSIELKKTVGNVALAKSLLVANILLRGQQDNIGEFICLQLGKQNGHIGRIQDMKSIMQDISLNRKIKNNLENKFINPIIPVMMHWDAFVNSTLGINSTPIDYTPNWTIDKHHKVEELRSKIPDTLDDIVEKIQQGNINSLKTLLNGQRSLNDQLQLAILEWIREVLKVNFPTSFDKVEISSLSPEICLMKDIETAIQRLRGTEVNDEVSLRRYQLSSSVLLTSPDNIANENVQSIRRIVEDSFISITTKVVDYTELSRKFTQDLMKSKGYTKAQLYTLGNMNVIYDNLWRKTNGKVTDLILKNPWESNDLNEAEKNYIKFSLYTLNKRRLRLNKVSEIDAAYHSGKLNDIKFYCVPLTPAKGLYRFRDANGESGMSVARIKQLIEQSQRDIRDAANLLDEDQIKERQTAADKLSYFYNQFHKSQDMDWRESTISHHGLGYFNTDLQEVLLQYNLADTSEQEFNTNTIPNIKSIMFVSMFNANITGKEQTVFHEFISKYAKNAIYGESIMEPEVQEKMKIIAPIRSAAFYIGLGWNFSNLPRELIMGFFTNISKAMFKTYGSESFSVKDYMQALGIMSGDIPNFIVNVTKIERINEFYRMANMSITEIPEQVKINKTGAMASFSRFISWALTAPDYWNRMSIFIAQMIHDGCWEAHTVETDEYGVERLKYDITKDKRFDVFVKYKGIFKDVPKELREKFNYQQSLFIVMRDEMNKTYGNLNEYKEGDPIYLPQAYTSRQRASFKSLADTTFGYYDSDTKALFFRTAVGQIFKQFMAYMSGKKIQYWQKGTNIVARGSFKQLTNNKGEKIYKLVNSEGQPETKLESELSQEEREIAKPVLAWQGAYIEGILQSYLHLLKELGGGSLEFFTKGNSERLKQLYREYGTRGNIRNSNLCQGLWDLLMAYFMGYLMRILFMDDPEITGESYDKQIRNSTAFTQYFFSTFDQAMMDFDLVNLVSQGLFTWEPPAFSILAQVGKNIFRNYNNEDLSFLQATEKSIIGSVGLTKPFRPYLYNLIEN